MTHFPQAMSHSATTTTAAAAAAITTPAANAVCRFQAKTAVGVEAATTAVAATTSITITSTKYPRRHLHHRRLTVAPATATCVQSACRILAFAHDGWEAPGNKMAGGRYAEAGLRV